MQEELIEMLDKMVKYFDEIPSDSYYYRETTAILDEAEKLVEKAKNSAKDPAVPQGEPVACLVRHRRLRTPAANAYDGQDHFSEWSDWEPARLKYGMAVTDPRRNSGPEHLFEMLPLYTTPAAPSQPVTLTDDEARAIYASTMLSLLDETEGVIGGPDVVALEMPTRFASAIIAALREKEFKQ